MRKTLIAALFAAALPTIAMAMPSAGEDGPRPPFAHDGGPRGEHHRGPDIFRDLDLNKEQRQAIGKIMGEQKHSRDELTRRYLDKLSDADKKAMQDEIKAKRDATDGKIRALLSPEQQKAFDEKKKQMEARRAEWQEFKAWKAKQAKAQ
ncbi:Spy/CpxP family protein refolding chaperone [Pseudomonas turukhanskensis]|uniref:LTXXQ domain protein n=1 Tax=Pseudomonas turukhanskensis TaxID=1806536 RepID=A0A9W6K5I1_9PSED|nr:Spy/CpxP family protein refolding chaperone [Pseudomonas turukhanskensis]GLK88641.1 hypothetical protein GCM10017655_17030 [Pseudomonas turukhanskensis]